MSGRTGVRTADICSKSLPQTHTKPYNTTDCAQSFSGIQAEVDRTTFSQQTSTASSLDGSASEIELESISMYINGNTSSTFVDSKTNFQVRVFSRGARPPSTSKAQAVDLK